MFRPEAIDTEKFRLLEEGGMIPKHQRRSYASEEFMAAVREAFGDLIPRIFEDGTGRYFHANYDEESRETVHMSEPLGSLSNWPRHELSRLVRGWRRLQGIIDSTQDKRLREMLQNIRLPHPKLQRSCYRNYTDNQGTQRVHILIGFTPGGTRERYSPRDLLLDLQRLHGAAAADAIAEPMPDIDAAPSSPARSRQSHPALREIRVSTPLALSCVLSLAAVFLARAITLLPELSSLH